MTTDEQAIRDALEQGGLLTWMAVAAHWLDPLHAADMERFEPPETWDDVENSGFFAEEDSDEATCEYWMPREVFRRYQPVAYALCNWMLYTESNAGRLYQGIETILHQYMKGCAFYELSFMGAGPTPEWLGAGLHDMDTDFWQASRATWVAEMLGLDTSSTLALSLAVNASRTFDMGECIPTGYQLLLQWLLERSGNTIFDTSYEEAMENGYGAEDWSNYPEIFEAWEEADDMLSSVLTALDEMDQQVEAVHVFCSNVLIAYASAIQEAFHDPRSITPQFQWPRALESGTSSSADPRIEILPDWDRAAA